ncbi:NAD-dependent epimerase/dehydratase family protein [Pontibacter sp. G13]|uniref:NAD-dependent epimerase/dehydratase family protein n=1 Tax=Pontibacter sp. G13 TaxID=3074898 RepID=UPI0028895E89|nr:NAD-dependent epimerase/dehydratase family protein [Pontibacter sp. G13]WNJ19843.1 NAD-dependent epimerase/dehydratase family protein [Pontibacter sp. G13]
MEQKAPILVTGATGYVASWIVAMLLEQGHQVRGTVRNKAKTEKYQHLLDKAAQTSGTLEIFEADLLKANSFDDATHGCEYVIHTASPFKTSVKNPDAELVQPALKGTQNVLNAVAKADSVKRVVLTSSVVAIYGDLEEVKSKPNATFTEDDWNETSSLTHQPYNYSKTVAEKAAWEAAKLQNRWSLTTIHPGFVLGPSLTKRLDSTSIDFVKNMGSGAMKAGAPNLTFATVDVRDVAKAHIEAAFRPEAHGRYVAVGECASILEIAQSVDSDYQQKLPLPTKLLPNWLLYIVGPGLGFSWKYLRKNLGISFKFDNTRTQKDLGIHFRPIGKTMGDHFDQLIEDGILAPHK